MFHILIVDDEPEIVDNLYHTMHSHFHDRMNITATEYSAEAIEIIRSSYIDILVSDIKMPEYSGFDVAREARKANPHAGIIFLTGYPEFDYARTAIKNRCDDYILKIEAEKELVESINRVIDVLEKRLNIEPAAKEKVAQMEASKVDVANKDAVEYIKKYIQDHIGNDISLQKLSGVVYISPTYLSKIFKQNTGVTLSTFITHTRIEMAKKLLESTQLKVHEIARSVGIDTAIYFNRLFKKETGITPREYRKMHYGSQNRNRNN